MRVDVLGGIDVVDDSGRRRPINGPRPRMILTVLATREGTAVAEDVLVDAIWGDAPPASAKTALQTYVSALRDELEPGRPRRSPGRFIRHGPTGYRLESSQVDTDLAEFLSEIERARRLHHEADARGAAEVLDRAIGMWRDPPLGEFVDETWALGVVARLREAHGEALEARFGLALDEGTERTLLDRLDAAVQSYPYRERLAGQRMLALYRSGRQRAALQQFAMTRQRLCDDLGLDPGRELCLLEQAILDHDPALSTRRGLEPIGSVGEPAPVAAARVPSKLVGRGEDVREVCELLDRERCVTIVGPGGVGKSSVAASVAREYDGRLEGNVVEIEFGELGRREPLRVVAEALRVVEHPLAPLGASVADAIGDDPLLVVAHTCEVDIERIGSALGTMLGVPGVRVLATSRVPLRIAGERVMRLEPLDDAAAIELLCAGTVGTAPNASDQETLRRIADHVDRLPLGLELAGARLDALGPTELLRGLSEGGDLLVGGNDRPGRHRSVKATVAWSLDLLDARLAGALETLSVLSAPFTMATAIALGIDVDAVGELVDHSILQRVEATPTRFRLPDSVRDEVGCRIDDARNVAARRRLAELCFDVAQARVFHLDHDVDLNDLAGEVVGAVAWFAASNDQRELVLAGYLSMFFIEQGRISEGREMLAAALGSHPDAPEFVRLLTSAQLGFLAWYQGDAHATARVLADVMRLLDHAPTESFKHVACGCLAFSERRFDDAARELGVAAADTSGAVKQRLFVLHLAGNSCWYAGDLSGAQRWYRDQRDLARAHDDEFHLAQSLRFEAMLVAQCGDIESAWRWAHRSVTMARDSDDPISLAQSSAASAIVASIAGVDEVATRHAVDAVEVGSLQFDVFALRTGLMVLAASARERGDDKLAAMIAGWYLDLLERTGQTHFPATIHLRSTIGALREELGPTSFAQLAAEGASSRVLDLARAAVTA